MRKAANGAEQRDLELLKAVAQAWYAHAGNAYPTNEFDARRAARSPRLGPSRFKIEAAAATEAPSWDFGRSLWDSYEIVTIAKKLEACNVSLDEPLSSPPAPAATHRKGKRRRESKKSLRSLLCKTCSSRFDDSEFPPEEDDGIDNITR